MRGFAAQPVWCRMVNILCERFGLSGLYAVVLGLRALRVDLVTIFEAGRQAHLMKASSHSLLTTIRRSTLSMHETLYASIGNSWKAVAGMLVS